MTTNEDCKVFNVSFSTMWGIERFPALNDFFQTAQQLGFSYIELNHQVNSKMLNGSNLHEYQFSSVHEPCPADISTESLKERDWLISSLDEENRRQGILAIQRSIDLANEIGARLVVVHSGCIQTDSSQEANLRELFLAGELHSAEYQAIKESMVQQRSRLAEPHLEAVLKSLQELVDYAGMRSVRLGVENRYHFFDIPNLDELGACLDLIDHGQMGWVYDVGHAHALDHLGFYSAEEWLTRYAERMVATHLHDIVGITDHLAPGLGKVDFQRIAPYLPAEALRTCELRTGNTAEQVQAGIQVLYEKGCVTCH